MRPHRLVTPLLATLLWLPILSAAAQAEGWKSDLELGFVRTDGNSRTQSLNTKGKTVHESDDWRFTGTGSAINTNDRGKTTAEKYAVSGKEDYKFSEATYLFGLIGYEKERFSGYLYRLSESVGLGHKLIDEEALKLELEAGGGARQSLQDSRKREREAIVRGAANLRWIISDSAEFSENLSAEGGKSGTVSKSVTALKNRISGNLSSQIGFTVKHNSKVPVGSKKSDAETAITLVFGF